MAHRNHQEIHKLLDRLELEVTQFEHSLQTKIHNECEAIKSHLASGEEKLAEMTESLERMQTAVEEVVVDTGPLQEIIEKIGELI